MDSDDTRLKRLKYRAWHRGFREADLILGPFADNHAQDMTGDELDELERLMDQPDQDLYDWIVERAPAPAEFDGPMLNRIRAFRFKAHQAQGPQNGG